MTSIQVEMAMEGYSINIVESGPTYVFFDDKLVGAATPYIRIAAGRVKRRWWTSKVMDPHTRDLGEHLSMKGALVRIFKHLRRNGRG